MNFQFCVNFITCRLPDSVRFGTNALAAVQSIKRLIFVEAVSANKTKLAEAEQTVQRKEYGKPRLRPKITPYVIALKSGR